MEKIADKIDKKDNSQEGSVRIAEQYKMMGRPYMRDHSISAS